MVWAFPPALYGAYEREYHESLGKRLSTCVCTMLLVTHPVGTWKREDMV
jgi:hypothetical protein